MKISLERFTESLLKNLYPGVTMRPSINPATIVITIPSKFDTRLIRPTLDEIGTALENAEVLTWNGDCVDRGDRPEWFTALSDTCNEIAPESEDGSYELKLHYESDVQGFVITALSDDLRDAVKEFQPKIANYFRMLTFSANKQDSYRGTMHDVAEQIGSTDKP